VEAVTSARRPYLPVWASRGRRGKLVWCVFGTEVVGMRLDSVVAVVRPGDDNGEELAVGAGQLGAAERNFPVEAQHRA
jgi:hypothetical protein